MEPEPLQQLKSLPVDPEQVWQGAVISLAEEASEPADELRPVQAAIWVSLHPMVLGHPQVEAMQRDPVELLLESLVAFSFGEMRGASLPGRIEVASAEEAGRLSDYLGDLGTEIAVVDPLEPLGDVLEELKRSLEDHADLVDRWSEMGLDPQRLVQLVDAGEAFLRAKLWHQLTEFDLLEVRRPKPPSGMRYFVVLGSEGMFRGLGCYDAPEEHFAVYRGDINPGHHALWQVAFDSVDEISDQDLAWAKRAGLSLERGQEYPFVQRFIGDMIEPANEKRVKFAAGLLAALAQTTEEQLDEGCWKVPVRLPGTKRATTFELAIPDLLDPPSYQEWLRRGAPLDPIAHDQLLDSLQQAVESQRPVTAEQFEKLLAQRAETQRAESQQVETERASSHGATPEEQAKHYTDLAAETFGRRRKILARQALEADPHCVDALLLLADLCSDTESQYEWYHRAYESARIQLKRAGDDRAAHPSWDDEDSRRLLRASFGLAVVAVEQEKHQEAIERLQQVIEWDPDDHQGGRYVLLSLLLAEGRDLEAARLVKQYNEQTAQWAYGQAILAFRLSGDTPASQSVLERAFELNPHVPELLATEDMPPPASRFQPGSVDEAVICIDEFSEALMNTPDVIQWMVDHAQQWRLGDAAEAEED